MKTYQNVIVQLARLGDLVQTLPLILSLQRRYGHEEMALVVDEQLADIAEMMVDSRHVVRIPVKSMLKAGLKPSLSQPWRLAKKVVKRLSNINAKRVINLNYHRPSAAVAEAIPAQQWAGAKWIDVVNNGATDELLIELFQANIGIRRGRRHLSDIWRDYAGREFIPESNSHESHSLNNGYWHPMVPSLECIGLAASLLSETGFQKNIPPVAIIPGSGHVLRRWSKENWIRLTQELANKAPVVIIGTEAESEMADAVMAGLKWGPNMLNVQSLCGKTDLKSLSGILSECRLAVGVDTGSLHLAAATGTPCLGIFFGSMHHRETGPYGMGNVVVVPDRHDYPCHESDMEYSGRSYENDISSDAVIRIVNSMLNGKVCSTPDAKVYVSVISNDGITWQQAGVATNIRDRQNSGFYQRVANAV